GQPAAQASTDAPPEWIASKAAADALLDQLERALRRCDASAAVKLYYRANATGAVPLRGDAGLLDRVLSLAVEDRTIDDAAFREFPRALGRARPDAATEQSRVRRRMRARFAAADWYGDLVAAAARRNGEKRKRAKLARLILGRIGRFWMPRVD